MLGSRWTDSVLAAMRISSVEEQKDATQSFKTRPRRDPSESMLRVAAEVLAEYMPTRTCLDSKVMLPKPQDNELRDSAHLAR